jgi:hypothetical protein
VTVAHPAADALEHLRRAALELVKAAHSGLDLVEDLVAEPRALSGLVGELAHAARVLLNEPPGGHPGPAGAASGASDGRTHSDSGSDGDRPPAAATTRGTGRPRRARGGPDDPGMGHPGAGPPPPDAGRRHRPGVQRNPLS